MTLLLKSKVRATNSIGNIHGILGPTDFSGMMDFSRDQYYTVLGGQRQDYALADAVTVARASPAPYETRFGEIKSVPANTGRIHYLPGYDTEGLLVSAGRTNLATSGASGPTISIPASSAQVLLSWRGGSAALASPNLTLTETYDLPNGRKAARGTNSGFNASLTHSGASDLLVELAEGNLSASPFPGYGATVATETVTLRTPFSSLLNGAARSMVLRGITLPSGASQSVAGRFIAAKTGAPFGGIYHIRSAIKTSVGTDSVQAQTDGGSNNPGATKAQMNGNWGDNFYVGVTWAGLGDTCGAISYGQCNEGTGIGAIFSTPNETVTIGGVSGMFNSNDRMGGIITHVVIWPRKLTIEEAGIIANQWL